MTDYTFYTEKYLLGRGAALDTASFPFWERKASQEVRKYTYGNIDESGAISEDVQLCVCEVAELLSRHEKEDSNIVSETSGKLSTTYKLRTSAEKNMEVYVVIHSWLSNTGLLYAGVR